MLKGHTDESKELRTNFFTEDGDLIRQEKLTTLREFIEMNRMRVGQKISLIEITDEATGAHTMPITLFVGNCTFDSQPSIGYPNSGWDRESKALALYVYEVVEYPYNGLAPASIMRYFDNMFRD